MDKYIIMLEDFGDKELRKLYYNSEEDSWTQFFSYATKFRNRNIAQILADVLNLRAWCHVVKVETTFTVHLYDEDEIIDMTQFIDKNEAIYYAEDIGAQEVVNDITGEVVYQK